MLLLELGVETCVRHKLLGTSGYHTLYDWYQQVGNEHFPDPTGLRLRMEEWTYGFYPACVKYLMDSFDVPEVREQCERQKWKGKRLVKFFVLVTELIVSAWQLFLRLLGR